MSATAFQRMRREAKLEELQEPKKKASNTEKEVKEPKKKAPNS
ncbi:hypothetical protein C8E03_11921 [Lachnotalea glycerini]|uniref:Uncharacterized protein n=1 Tax=Lachnotalea glycerini TaxID=1763509 RepID=A0A318EGL4_9FIRM|nr:hypothetical protein [Lachnotalea glycerini]PXV85097.1 hypothetical protein C8E03_11921 [Lachnotalea glycerini]